MAYCVRDDATVFQGSISKKTCEQSLGGQWTLDQEEAAGWVKGILNPAPPTDTDADAIPETILPTTDPCGLAVRWQIAPRLASKLVKLAGRVEFGIQIISGYRTPQKQTTLAKQGRPTAKVACSTHTWCPATGADLWTLTTPVNTVKARLGSEGVLLGLRWGGGGKMDPETGIPKDWNHFDLGPRCT